MEKKNRQAIKMYNRWIGEQKRIIMKLADMKEKQLMNDY
jgi:hypothetical protein